MKTHPSFRWIACALLLALCPLSVAEDEEYPHGEYEGDCTQCHSTDQWVPVQISEEFEHAAGGFRLEGSHHQTDCRACHKTLEFVPTERECAGCHLDPHLGELGLDCGRCHTPRSFIDRAEMTRAHLATRLPLDGTHRTIDCEDCHEPAAQGQMQFVNTPVECVDCHRDDYLGTTDPDHQTVGFPEQCESCHTTRLWQPASFNHTAFGATDCVSCHLDDYLGTTNPDHQAAGFPQQCDACHSTLAWVPLSGDGFNHDQNYFPIYSGRHRGKWMDCADCHTNPSNFSDFTCTDCHAHDDPVDLAGKHESVSGYVYESQECFNCHPTGEE